MNFCTKRAKLVQLMHKFVQRSRVGMFCDERTRSSPLVPEQMFWGISDRFVLHKLRSNTCRTGAINAQFCATKSLWNFSQRTHPIYPIGPQTPILGRFGPFPYSTNFIEKCAELVQLTHKFVQWSRVGIFRNVRTRSTLLDSKLMFWGISYRYVIARTSVQNRRNWCD
jgi:hypothetical protein